MTEYDQIRTLLASYCHRLDDDDRDSLLALFTTDAVVVRPSGERVEGTEQLARWTTEVTDAEFTPLPVRHVCFNSEIRVEGEVAYGLSDWLSVWRSPHGFYIGGAGRYEDEYRREAGSWLFRRRVNRRWA